MDAEWISNEVSTVDNPLDALVTRDADSVYEACRRRDYVTRFLLSFHE